MQRMRYALFVFGWAPVIGSILDAAIGLYAFGLVAAGVVRIDVSVDIFLRDFLGFLYWIKEFALRFMPPAVVKWLFGLPALAYFPTRVVLGLVLGSWALIAARRRKSQS